MHLLSLVHIPRDLGQFNLLQTGNLNLKSFFLRIEFIFDIRIIISIKLKIYLFCEYAKS